MQPDDTIRADQLSMGVTEEACPPFGQRGVLATDDHQVQCHLCGTWFAGLAHHVRQAHGVSAAAYRERFGFPARTPLDAPALRARKREHAPRPVHAAMEKVALGAWDGPIVGALGVFARDGDRVQCHICGKLCKSVGNHAFLAHGVTADDYRTIFGLKSSTGLVTAEISERRSQVPEALRVQQGVSTQYLAAGRRSRPLALEARLDPNLQAMRRAAGTKGGACNRERWANPEEHQRRREQLIAARGGRVDVTCASCGAPLQVPPSAAKAYRHHLCSDTCIAAFRAWWAKQLLQVPRHRQHQALVCTHCDTAFQGQRGQRYCSRRCRNRAGHAQRRRPTICPTCAQTFAAAKNQRFCSQRCAQRQFRAETAARLSALRRQHGRPHAEVLRSLPDSAFAVLSPLEQQVVRLYYGLDDGHPWSQREIGQHCTVAVVRVRPIVHAAVARLVATDQTHTGR